MYSIRIYYGIVYYKIRHSFILFILHDADCVVVTRKGLSENL